MAFSAGKRTGRVRPNKPITRGEFVTSLAKFCGVDESYRYYAETGYRDIGIGQRAGALRQMGARRGLMDGSDAAFHPDDYLTREQMATVVARYLTARGALPAALRRRHIKTNRAFPRGR